MKKVIMLGALSAVMAMPTAFAKNLGALSEDHQPQNLLPAGEYVKFLNSSADATQPQDNLNSTNSNSLYYGYGYGYWPYYYGYWLNDQGGEQLTANAARTHLQGQSNVTSTNGTAQEHLNSPNTSSLYYGYGYWPYYGGYYGYYWLNDQGGDHLAANANHSHVTVDRAQAPVVCFASDTAGNFFAQVDAASNVVNSQQAVNSECLASGGACTQNLGCAIAAR